MNGSFEIEHVFSHHEGYGISPPEIPLFFAALSFPATTFFKPFLCLAGRVTLAFLGL